jgi:hypothetical protein
LNFGHEERIRRAIDHVREPDFAVHEKHAIAKIADIGRLIELIVIERGVAADAVVGAELVSVLRWVLTAAVGMARALKNAEPRVASGEQLWCRGRSASVGSNDIADLVVERALFGERQNPDMPGPAVASQWRRGDAHEIAHRKGEVCIVVVMQRQTDLLKIVRALRPPGRFASRLHGGQEQRHQDADNSDHHQQFDERKGSPRTRFSGHKLLP